jgi:hypothetical protein
MIYIFSDSELVNNLLGLASFVDMVCTAVFKPSVFHLYRGRHDTPVLSERRQSALSLSLWQVDLAKAAFAAHPSDGIPPPQAKEASGIYVEANSLTDQNAGSYFNFVHASLGYPAPSSFLRAVTDGFITGPHQFPRLTAKMVCRHLPNALPTAKGHLDRRPSSFPHAGSDAVSALERHHTRSTRSKMMQVACKALPA